MATPLRPSDGTTLTQPASSPGLATRPSSLLYSAWTKPASVPPVPALDGATVLKDVDKRRAPAGVRGAVEDLEVQAVDHDAQSFRGAGNAAGRHLGSDDAGVEGIDPAARVVGIANIAQALQEVEVEGLDEGGITGQGVGFEGADILSAGIRPPAVRAEETTLVGGHRSGDALVDGGAARQKGLGRQRDRARGGVDRRAAVGR